MAKPKTNKYWVMLEGVLQRFYGTITKTKMINKESVKKKIMENEFLFATDISEFLIKKGHSYREAHDITGSIVKYCIKNDVNVSQLSEDKLKSFSSNLTAKAVKKKGVAKKITKSFNID